MNSVKLKGFDPDNIYNEIYDCINVTRSEARMLLRVIHECDFMTEGDVYYMVKHSVDISDTLVNLAMIANGIGYHVKYTTDIKYDIGNASIDICNTKIRVVSADSDGDDIYKINRTKDVIFYSSTLFQ